MTAKYSNESELIEAVSEWTCVHRAELISDISALVGINTVKDDPAPDAPFGHGVAEAMEFAAALGEKYGYITDKDDGYTISFLRKGETDRELGILAHIDVVPAGGGWSYEPFAATQIGDYLIGRGTGDNKGPAAAGLYVLRVLGDLGINLRHTIRVIWGGNEESGMLDIPHYLKTHEPPECTLVPDAAFPLCYGEKGMLTAWLVSPILDNRIVDIYGGVATNSVPDSAYIIVCDIPNDVIEKLSAEPVHIETVSEGIKISAQGKASHAAFPVPDSSAIQHLAAAVVNCGMFSGETHDAFMFIAEAFSDVQGAGLGISCKDDIGTETTHIGGMIRMRGGRIMQNINVRFAIKEDPERLRHNLSETAKSHGFQVEDLMIDLPRYDSLDDPRIKLLIETSKELTDAPDEPFTMGGGTHARKMPNAVPYGPIIMSEALKSPPPYGSAHGPDEAVSIQSLLDMIKIYVVTLIRLDNFQY